MKSNFTLCIIHNNIVQITDLTKEDNEYLNESVEDNLIKYYNDNIFKYSETCTLNIIQYKSVKNGDIILEKIYNKHTTKDDIANFILNKDGYYRIYHLIIPTIEWYESLGDKTFLEGKDIFITNGDQIFEVNDGEYTQINENILTLDTNNSTISKSIRDTFSIFYLKECYIKLSKNILENNLNTCFNKINREAVYNRDLIWTSLNIIKYEVELNYLYEAQIILEKLISCNSICSHTINNIKYDDCGCGNKN